MRSAISCSNRTRFWRRANKIKFVYTPLHGTGIRAIPALLDQFGFSYSIVETQAIGDGRFPTVKSPNPENAEALELAIKQAEDEQADIVMATDPDCRPHGRGRARRGRQDDPAHRQPDRLDHGLLPHARA